MIRKFFTIILLLLLTTGAWAQTAVKLTYDVTSLEPGDFDIFKSSLVIVFNDSLVYSYMVLKSDPMRKRKEAFGEYFINHGTYNRRGSSAFYHTTIKYNRATSTDSSRVTLVSHTYNPITWTFYTLGKTIYGYDTQTAVSIRKNKDGVSDTTIVWYAPALPQWKNVMGQYAGIKGLPLEIQEQFTDRKITLVKIEQGDFFVTFPKGLEVLTHEEYHNRYHVGGKNKKGHQKEAPNIIDYIKSKYY